MVCHSALEWSHPLLPEAPLLPDVSQASANNPFRSGWTWVMYEAHTHLRVFCVKSTNKSAQLSEPQMWTQTYFIAPRLVICLMAAECAFIGKEELYIQLLACIVEPERCTIDEYGH